MVSSTPDFFRDTVSPCTTIRSRRARVVADGLRAMASARSAQRSPVRSCVVLVLTLAAGFGLSGALAAPGYTLLGQPTVADGTLASRCADVDARFNFANDGGFEMHGPAGLAIDPRGRIWVTDFGGRRVLSWPDATVLQSCEPADTVIGSGELAGPEAVAFDPRSALLFVADTLDHTVKGYRHGVDRSWNRVVTLGTSGVAGNGAAQFQYPRGLAVDPGGRLFVADDYNHRVLIFDPPFTDGEAAADSIGAFADGGFQNPKALAMIGHTLFVADYGKSRVLRFTGPFRTPEQVYASSGTFGGVASPVDLAVHPDGSLLVTDQGGPRIARYTDAAFRASAAAPSAVFADHLGPEPLGVAADRNGRIYLADYRAYRVLIRQESVRRTPVTAASLPAVRALLANLHRRPALRINRVLLGQQLITWLYGPQSDPNAWYGDWLQLQQAGLALPKVMGGELSDLMSYRNFAPNQDALDELIRHGQAGGIVTLVWHPANPTGGAFGVPIGTASLRAALRDDSVIGRRWQVQLDRAAAVLQQFEDAGVPVLFRPLHEQNGDFFWWGHDHDAAGSALRARQAAWVGLWRDLVTELTVRKGLSNLLFAFGTNQVNYDGVAPPLTYYAGARWVDVVSMDLYDEQLDMAGAARGLQHYATLVGTGKPFGLAEFGQSFGPNGTGANAAAWDARTLVNRIRDSYSRTTFAVAWYSSVEGGRSYVFALPDVAHTAELLQDPLIDTQ